MITLSNDLSDVIFKKMGTVQEYRMRKQRIYDKLDIRSLKLMSCGAGQAAVTHWKIKRLQKAPLYC